MSDSKKKYPQKTYCYMSDCKPVRAGFHLENYASCSKCKLELSEKLYNDLKSKDKSLEDIKKEIEDMWDEEFSP